jgi:K+-sensing histidine kinase KdpD
MPHQPLPPAQPPVDRAEELLAMVAHELRRPLAALLGALATVRQRGPALPTAQQWKLVGMAHRQGLQLQRLLDQVLAAAALGHPSWRVARQSLVDVVALAKEAGVAGQLAHPDHPITIQGAGPLLVRADPLTISRILGNLLDNAAAYSPPGAAIRLVAGRNGPHALLVVQD